MYRKIAPLALISAALLAACGGSDGNDHVNAAKSEAPEASADAGALQRAAESMAAADSFTFRAAINTSGTVTEVSGEFQAPDRVHQMMTVADAPVSESVFAGGKAYLKDAVSGTWSDLVQSVGSTNDPRAVFGVLASASNVTADGDTLTFTLSGDAAVTLLSGAATAQDVTLHGTATVSGDHITALSYEAPLEDGTLRVRVSYNDFGTAPAVDIPAVG